VIRALVFLNSKEILKTAYFSCFHSIVAYSGITFLPAKYSFYRRKLFRIMAGPQKGELCRELFY
jgi:hypothetical protein